MNVTVYDFSGMPEANGFYRALEQGSGKRKEFLPISVGIRAEGSPNYNPKLPIGLEIKVCAKACEPKVREFIEENGGAELYLSPEMARELAQTLVVAALVWERKGKRK